MFSETNFIVWDAKNIISIVTKNKKENELKWKI